MKMNAEDIADGCTPRQGPLAEIHETPVCLNDVVLPDEIRSELRFWLKQVSESRSFTDKWGLDKLALQSKSNALLIYGPPGTGKTLTAQAIAGELGKPLFIARYDQIESMWFGVAEKNIVKVFEYAARENGVLLFDECDAFFSKRTEVLMAGHKHLNREVNILLQMLEKYDGIVILTTNLSIALDEGLERRIGLRLELPPPGPELREKIWRSLFSDKAPLAPDVDFRYLADRFNFTGGYIKNAVLHVVRRCAAEGREVITQALLEESAQAEQSSRWTKHDGKSIGFGINGKAPC